MHDFGVTIGELTKLVFVALAVVLFVVVILPESSNNPVNPKLMVNLLSRIPRVLAVFLDTSLNNFGLITAVSNEIWIFFMLNE